MVAFIASLIILALLVAPIFPYAKRRKVGAPLTWGEAMAASVYVFFVMFWSYGTVPNLWLTWTSNELNWRPDKLVYEYWTVPGVSTLLTPQEKGGPFPVIITMQTLRDLIVVLIYVVFLGGQLWLWAFWQKRGEKKSVEVATSEYGRPLVKSAVGARS
ncbi:MAG: hypothetical protein HYX32_11120 [Actinobacteria bacterium]|nr:hypothetical protein [Actinomycetota bacterium]